MHYFKTWKWICLFLELTMGKKKQILEVGKLGINVGLGQSSGLSSTVWESLRIARRHSVQFWPGNSSPLWYPQKYNFKTELGDHWNQDGFYMHKESLAYLAVFCHASLETGISGPELCFADRVAPGLINPRNSIAHVYYFALKMTSFLLHCCNIS